jgi:hypothetical protein
MAMNRRSRFDPFVGIGGLDLRGITRGFDLTRLIGDRLRLHESVTHTASQLWRQSPQLDRLFSPSMDFTAAFRNAQLQLGDFGGISHVFKRLDLFPTVALIDRQVNQMRLLEDALGKCSFPISRMPVATVMESLAVLTATIETVPASSQFMEEAAKLPQSYLAFAKRQSKRIIEAETEEEGSAASLVLDHVGAMLGDSSAVLQQAMSDCVETEESQLVLPDDLNLFVTLNRSVARLYKQGTVTEVESAVGKAQATQIHGLGYAIVSLVNEVNQAHSLATGERFFVPSMQTMEAALLLPNHAVGDEVDFARAVDALYFMLWEAAGSTRGLANKWLQEKVPGMEPLQMVRDLRRTYRHDLEQEPSTANKLLKAGDVFKRLISQARPVRPTQWRAAQIALYLEVHAMMQMIQLRIALLG